MTEPIASTLTEPVVRTFRGIKLDRDTLSIIVLAVGVGILVGAKLAKDSPKPCDDCERVRAENQQAILHGAVARRQAAEMPMGTYVPPGFPTGPAKDEPPTGGVVVTPEGGAFPLIPPAAEVADTWPDD